MSYDQGIWDALGRVSHFANGASEREQRTRMALIWLAQKLDLSKADRRDLLRILEGKQPYRKKAA